MEFQDILTAITNVGFPIVVCIACGWFIKYTLDKQREEIAELNAAHAKQIEALNSSHKEEMEKMTEAVNNNTIALTRLTERLERDNAK